MHDRHRMVVWRLGRLLGPAVVAHLCWAPSARADTPRRTSANAPAATSASTLATTPASASRSLGTTARWWGPLRLGRRAVAARHGVRPSVVRSSLARPVPLVVAQRAAGQVARPRPGGARLGQRCGSDAQCVEPGTICERRRCVRIQRTINIMWLFYRSADRRYTSALGLYHHRRGTPGLRILAPFYFHVWSKLSDTRVVLPPLFVQHKNRLRGSTDTFVLNFHHHRSKGAVGFNVWPFLFVKSYGKKGFSFSLLPLVHYARKGKAWSMYLLLFPPWYVSRAPGKTTWAVFPFAAGKTTRRRSLTWVFPLNFYWRRGSRRHYLFFPLYYGQTSRHSAMSLLLPLYWYYRRGKHYRQFISPLAVYGHDRRARRWHLWWTAPPTLFTRRPGHSLSMVLPFFYHHHARSRERLLVLPALASYFYRRPGVREGMVGPLHYRRDSRRSHTVFFPLFWRFKNHATQLSFTMVGNVYVRRDPKGYSAAVLPLLYLGKHPSGCHQIFFPLFWRRVDRLRQKSVTQLFTAYWWRHRDSFGHGLLPLYGYERRYDAKGYVSSRLGILPLLYHVNNRTDRVVLTPLGGYVHDKAAHRKTLVVGNVFWHRAPGLTVWSVVPLLWRYASAGGNTTVVFPLYWRLRPRGGWKTDLVLPLFALLRKRQRRLVVVGPVYSYERPGARSFGLAPLLFVRVGRRLSYGHFFPLVWHKQDHVRKTGYTVVGPIFNVRRRQGHTSGVFPLLWWGRRGPARYGVGFPLVWYFDNARRRTRTLVVGPVFHHRNRSATYGGVVPAVFWHADPKKRRYTVWSGPFLYRQRRERVFAMVAPLLFLTRRSPRRWSLTIAPLLHYRKNHHRHHLWTPLFGFGVNQRAESRYGYVGPVGWTQSPTRNAQVVFPLFWRFVDKRRETATVAVPPLYFGHRHRQGRTDVFLPLFVHRKRGPRRAVVLFPLVYSFFNSRSRSRTLVAFPFYYWRRRETTGGGLIPLVFVRRGPRGARDVTVVPLLHVRRRRHRLDVWTPLFGFGFDRRRGRSYGYAGPVYWSKSPKKNAQVVFPLFWRFADKRARRTGLAILPFYIGTRSRRSSVDVVPPLFWMHRTANSRTVVFLPFYVGRFQRNRSSWSVAVPLFYYHYHFPSREHRVLVPPGLYVRHGPARTDVVLFPLLWHFSSRGRSSTVVFPLYWDFKRGHRRSTVVFPLVWRFSSGHKLHTVVLNTYYGRDREKGTYRLLVLPFLEVARKRPGDIKVGFLGGLLGYERIGRNRYLKLFFARIRLKPLPAQPGPGRRPQRRSPGRSRFFPI